MRGPGDSMSVYSPVAEEVKLGKTFPFLPLVQVGWGERGGGGAEDKNARTSKDVFMYLRAILCTFQISVDFYYICTCGWERRG